MSATINQFAALLNLLPEPARVYDVQGRVVSENQAAQGAAWPDDNGGDGRRVATTELGEGWYLRRLDLSDAVPTAPGATPNAALPQARPNLQALLAGITHELRNPMAAILTAVSLLQEDSGLGEESAMLLGVVRKEARRMNQIMTEFSLYVKPPQPRPENSDVAKMIRDIVDTFKQENTLWQNVNVIDKMPSTLMAYADSSQIQQALSRIIENAAEAIAKCAQPNISLSGHIDAETKQVMLCIEDNGPGLNVDELQRAFLPFFSTKPQSTGLGLSTAQVAVQAAGGSLWLENLPGAEPDGTDDKLKAGGARLCCVLPVAQ